jgi:hypothetical protein
VSAFEPKAAIAKASDGADVVTNEYDGSPLFRYLIHFAHTFSLEARVADCEHFVHQQKLGFQVGGHSKGQPQVHAARIMLDRSVNEFLDLRERNNLVKSPVNLGAPHTQDGAIQVGILPPRQFVMKTRTNFQQ